MDGFFLLQGMEQAWTLFETYSLLIRSLFEDDSISFEPSSNHLRIAFE